MYSFYRQFSSQLALIAALSMGAVACGPHRQVGIVQSGAAGSGGLSGYWNEADAQAVVKTLTQQMFAEPWIGDFRQRERRKPIIKLRGVTKRTDDRNVNVRYFANQLQRVLIQSGQVRVVAAAGQEGINVRERDRQSEHASDESAKTQGDELGADYTLQTEINSQNDQDGRGRTIRAYLVNMLLVDVQTNETVFFGEKKIIKDVRQRSTRL